MAGTAWDDAGAGALSGAAAGIPLDAATGGLASVVGGLAGGALGYFGHQDAPQYTDPNQASRQVLANNLMSAKTGEDYTAHATAQNEARGKEMYDQISRDYSGNPAISSSLYNNVGRNVENENTSAGIEGARINQDDQKAAGDLLSKDSELGFKEWTANTDRASMPSPLETIATQSLGTLAGKGLSSIGKGGAAPGLSDDEAATDAADMSRGNDQGDNIGDGTSTG